MDDGSDGKSDGFYAVDAVSTCRWKMLMNQLKGRLAFFPVSFTSSRSSGAQKEAHVSARQKGSERLRWWQMAESMVRRMADEG